jgi:hypothetical protein
MIDLNQYINVDQGGSAVAGRPDEVDDKLRAELAKRIQQRVKNRMDPGIDVRDAKRFSAIRAKEEAGRIILTDKDETNPYSEDDGEGGVEDLFTMGSGIPKVVNGKLEFRTMSPTNIFVRRSQETQDQQVRDIVSNTVQTGIVDDYSKAVQDVENMYPHEKTK